MKNDILLMIGGFLAFVMLIGGLLAGAVLAVMEVCL